MIAAMRKRHAMVKAQLDQARNDVASGGKGILVLGKLIEAEIAAGKLIFDMVLAEEGSDQDLQSLVSQRALFQTIVAALDHRSAIMSCVNQDKSRATMRLRRELLYDWLDQNIGRYSGSLDDCAEDAVEQISGLGMKPGTVKRHITQYRKEKGLVAKKPKKISKKTQVAS